jgi:hypothetical protein
MYLCYIDESGTPDIPGNTSHFILAGLSMPVWHWRGADREIRQILVRFGLENQEFHTAWLLRSYLEQSKVANFEAMDWVARRSAVQKLRTSELLRLQRLQQSMLIRLLVISNTYAGSDRPARFYFMQLYRSSNPWLSTKRLLRGSMRHMARVSWSRVKGPR